MCGYTKLHENRFAVKSKTNKQTMPKVVTQRITQNKIKERKQWENKG